MMRKMTDISVLCCLYFTQQQKKKQEKSVRSEDIVSAVAMKWKENQGGIRILKWVSRWYDDI